MSFVGIQFHEWFLFDPILFEPLFLVNSVKSRLF